MARVSYTPAERALADVEKAIKNHDKATEKREALQEKADVAYEAEKRSLRELNWMANHPDLPDDFDLDEFRRSLEEPFADDVDPVEPDEGAVAEGAADVETAVTTPVEDKPEPADEEQSPAAEISDAVGEDDDPWAETDVA